MNPLQPRFLSEKFYFHNFFLLYIQMTDLLIHYLKNTQHFQRLTINTFTDLEHWYFIVCTFGKCGTTSLATALQTLIKPSEYYTNVIHCHDENCWKRNIFHHNDDIPFTLSDMIRICNKYHIKPLIFQLYREPFSRFYSRFFYMYHENTIHSLDIISFLKFFINPYEGTVQKSNYETAFNFSFSETQLYHDTEKYGFLDASSHFIYFTSIEYLHRISSHLSHIFSINNPFPTDFHSLQIEKLNSLQETPDIQTFISTLWMPVCIVDFLYETEHSLLSFYYTFDEIVQMKQNCLFNNTKITMIPDDESIRRLQLLRPHRLSPLFPLPHWNSLCYIFYLLADNIPLHFDDRIYTHIHSDLRNLSPLQALLHYEYNGFYESRSTME